MVVKISKELTNDFKRVECMTKFSNDFQLSHYRRTEIEATSNILRSPYVAVKSFRSKQPSHSATERYEREIFASEKLATHHDNVVRLYGVLRAERQIVMEWVDGEPLWPFALKAYDDKDQKWDIIRQLLEAIKHIHANGVVHNDVNMDNVMVQRIKKDHKVKLINFGFASPPGQLIGHADVYTAPEVEPSSKFNEKVDIWSIGCVTHDLMMGEKLEQDTLIRTPKGLKKILQSFHKAYEHDVKFYYLLKAMLTIDPAQRPSAHALLQTYFE